MGGSEYSKFEGGDHRFALPSEFERFPVLETMDLGKCVVIPAEELELDWIRRFLKDGFRFEGTRLDGHPVVLVQVKPLEK